MNPIVPRPRRFGNLVSPSGQSTSDQSTSDQNASDQNASTAARRSSLAGGTLRSNPFCTRLVRPGAVDYWFRETHTEDALSAIREIVTGLCECRRGLIVGAHGTGKTTLLYALRPGLHDSFEEVRYVQLSAPGSNRLRGRYIHMRRTARELFVRQAQLGHGGLLVVDGVEQLWRFDLWRLLRKAKRNGQAVLATSHHPVGGMRILHQTRVTRKLVRALTESLLADAAPELARVVLEELGRRECGGLTNVRDLWFDLYDVAQAHLVPTASLSTLQEQP